MVPLAGPFFTLYNTLNFGVDPLNGSALPPDCAALPEVTP